MAHPLDGCRERLRRADVHIREVEGIADAFLDGKPPPYQYTLPELNEDPWAQEFDIVARVVREPPAVKLGAVIADAVNNLRAALDNLVWELTVAHQAALGSGPPSDPIPFRSKWRKVRFPIFIHSNWHPDNLWGVRPGLLADFKQLQPTITGKNAPEREPLAILEELWNIDKHRHLHLGQWLAGLAAVRSGLVEAWGGEKFPEDIEYEILSPIIGPFVDGAVLGRVRMHVPKTFVVGAPAMYMKPALSIDVAFEQGPPAFGEPVVSTLKDLRAKVSGILDQFADEFA